MLKRRLAALSVVVALLGAVVACGSESGGTSRGQDGPDDDYRVLAILAMSGPASTISNAEVQALQASAAEINANGGIGGRHVVIDVVDDSGDPTKAVGLLQKELDGDPPDAVWPGATGNEARALLPILTREKILAIGAVGDSKTTVEKYPYYFVTYPPQTATAQRLVDYVRSKGVKTLGLLYGSDAYGSTSAKATEAAMAKAGIRTVSEGYQPNTLDFTGVLGRLREQDPDMLWVEAIGTPGPQILKDRAKLGWDVPVIGDLTLATQPLTELVDQATLEGVTLQAYQIQVWVPPAERSPALTTMVDAVKAKGPMTMPMHIYSFAYDALWLLHQAAAQAGSTDSEAMTNALEHLRSPAQVPWVSFKTYGYTPQSHFVAPQPGDYAFINPGPVVDGMIQPGT